jgi:AcrR family transcriptional regulator
MAGRTRRADSQREPQLPSGRHGLPRSAVVSNQRERIMRSLVATMASYGYAGSSVERIAARAGVSRRTFYEQFAGREDAYLQTYDMLVGCLLERAGAAWEEPGDGRDQLRTCLRTVLDSAAGEPRLARFCLVEVFSVGAQALEHRELHMRSFAALLEKAARAHNGAPPPPLVGEGLVAAISDAMYKRVAQGNAEELPDLLEDLYSFCLMLFRYEPVPQPR